LRLDAKSIFFKNQSASYAIFIQNFIIMSGSQHSAHAELIYVNQLRE